jgi:hypothetical protein
MPAKILPRNFKSATAPELAAGSNRRAVLAARSFASPASSILIESSPYIRACPVGGTVRIIVLDNLKEGVLTPDIYDPAPNPLFRDVLAHYGVVALPCRVGDPDRKGKVEAGVGHAKKTPFRGLRFESHRGTFWPDLGPSRRTFLAGFWTVDRGLIAGIRGRREVGAGERFGRICPTDLVVAGDRFAANTGLPFDPSVTPAELEKGENLRLFRASSGS